MVETTDRSTLDEIFFGHLPHATVFCDIPSLAKQYERLQSWSRHSDVFPQIPRELLQEERRFPELTKQRWSSFWVLFPYCNTWNSTQNLSCQLINSASFSTTVDYSKFPKSPWDWKRYNHRCRHEYDQTDGLYALEVDLIYGKGFTAQEMRCALGDEFHLLGVETFVALGLLESYGLHFFAGRTIAPVGSVVLEDKEGASQSDRDIVPYIQCGRDEYVVKPGWANQRLGDSSYVPVARSKPLLLCDCDE